MKQPSKWRETMDPFSLHFENFELHEVLGYPYAGNDVFYVRGIINGSEARAFLKVERQKTADIEILSALKLGCYFPLLWA